MKRSFAKKGVVQSIFYLMLALIWMLLFIKPVNASTAPSIPFPSNSKTATTWNQFVSYISDGSVDEIKLGGNINATSSISSINFPPRDLTISGGEANYGLNMAGYMISLNSTETSRLLSVVNVELSGSGTGFIFDATISTSPNWTLNFKNSNLSANGNTKRLANLASGSVYFSDGATLRNAGSSTSLIAKKLFINDGFSYSATNASGAAFTSANLFETTVTDGEVSIFNSDFFAQTAGTIFSSSGAGNSFTLHVQDSRVNIPRANNVYSGLGGSDIEFKNSPTQLGTVTKSPFITARALSPINVKLRNSPISGTNITDSIFTASGTTSSITAELDGSPIKITETGGGIINATSVSSNVSARFNLSSVEIPTVTGPLIAGGKINSQFQESSVKVGTNFTAHLFQVNLVNSIGSTLSFDNSDIFIRRTSIGNINVFQLHGTTKIEMSNSIGDINVSNKFIEIRPTAPGSEVLVNEGTILNVHSTNKNVITAGTLSEVSPNATFNVDGKKTNVTFTSNSTEGSNDAGIIFLNGEKSKINVSNAATLTVRGLSTSSPSAILLNGKNGGLYVKGNSILNAETKGSSSIYSSTVRFDSSNMTFDVSEGSKIDIKKYGGANAAQGIRLQGEDNIIRVRGGADFKVYNQGYGSGGTNQGIFYASVNYAAGPTNIFDVQDSNSNVSIISEKGRAIESVNNNYSGYLTEIRAGDDTYFVARGFTTNATEGIFSGVVLNIDFTSMKYYDFGNTRTNGGRLFSSSNAISIFDSKKSKLSVWKAASGVNIYGDPNKRFSSIDFRLSGTNFNKFISGSVEAQSYFESSGGMPTFTRMTGDNQRAKISDIRIPTNSDKYIWIQATIPQGKEEEDRPAFTGEVGAEIGIFNSNGTLAYTLKGTSVGNDNNNGGISIYGEPSVAGIIKIPVPENSFLKTGQKIVIQKVWRGEELTENVSRADDIMVKEAVVIDVTPPSKPKIDNSITNTTKQISGEGEEGANVFLKVNGEWLKDTKGNYISANVVHGKWLINLPEYLSKLDLLEVYLKDNSTIDVNTKYDLPSTYTLEPNDSYGNISESPEVYKKSTGYHDAVIKGDKDYRFDQALEIKVLDVLPDQPTLINSVKSSGGSVTAIGDSLIYTIKVKNDKTDAMAWEDVKLETIIPATTTFDTLNTGITINGSSVTDNMYKYENDTRKLTIFIGDIIAKNEVEITFQVKVNSNAFGSPITNIVRAEGNSPQESPFVSGPLNLASPRVVIDVTSSPVSIPGGTVTGSLSLESVPVSFNFGSIVYDARTQRIDNPNYNNKIIVKDTRAVTTGGWSMTATLTEPMKNNQGKFLLEALRYVYGGKESILSDNAQVVYKKSDGGVGSYSVSDSWGDSSGTDGLKLQIESSDVVYTGNYTGVITWKLMAGTP